MSRKALTNPRKAAGDGKKKSEPVVDPTPEEIEVLKAQIRMERECSGPGVRGPNKAFFEADPLTVPYVKTVNLPAGMVRIIKNW